MNDIKKIGIVGTGVIGAGWAARALANGLDVVAWDPAPDAEEALRINIDNAWPALVKMGLFDGADRDRLTFTSDLVTLCRSVDLIQESAPENLELKIKIHKELGELAPKEVLIASSTSGLLPSDFQAESPHPERHLVGHPFNPVYLLPLCEICGGKLTSDENMNRAVEYYRAIGMYPLKLKKEVAGFLSDRLQEALWRENMHVINDGYADTKNMDDAICYGPGLRWAMMGTNEAFLLAGGDGGMRHFFKQFGPTLELPWTKLKAPELTDDLIDKFVEGTDKQRAGRSIKEMERLRDDCLIAIMQALRTYKVGAGQTIDEHDSRRIESAGNFDLVQAEAHLPATPSALYQCNVRPDWVDYNGHMSEAYYVLVFGHATDALYDHAGMGEDYRAQSKCSLYTVESHIRFLHEVNEGALLELDTQVLGVDAKRVHFCHLMKSDGIVLATTELMAVHVNTVSGRSVPMTDTEQVRYRNLMIPDPPAWVGRSIQTVNPEKAS